MSGNYLPFAQVVEEIRQLCRKEATGSLFISTDCNRSAHMILTEGEIVFIYYFNLHGIEALDAMGEIANARHHFQEGMITDQRTPLPPTGEILNTLAEIKTQTASQDDDCVPAPVFECSDEQRSVIETCLAEYIGPVAPIICDDILKSALNLDAALSKLAEEIPSEEEARQFLKEVQAQLG
ncbi:hypothetical protein [Pontibacterium sp.]|uniref:hypothetical protein n=1 Tax=Pontibacterium sp. TaxID=2036026 RepID=UPI003512AED7